MPSRPLGKRKSRFPTTIAAHLNSFEHQRFRILGLGWSRAYDLGPWVQKLWFRGCRGAGGGLGHLRLVGTASSVTHLFSRRRLTIGDTGRLCPHCSGFRAYSLEPRPEGPARRVARGSDLVEEVRRHLVIRRGQVSSARKLGVLLPCSFSA